MSVPDTAIPRGGALSPGEKARIGDALGFALATNARHACATVWASFRAWRAETGPPALPESLAASLALRADTGASTAAVRMASRRAPSPDVMRQGRGKDPKMLERRPRAEDAGAALQYLDPEEPR